MNGDLICRSHVADYIKRRSPELRPGWPLSRVSAEALDEINTKVRLMLDSMIASHPSIGKTFKLRAAKRKQA